MIKIENGATTAEGDGQQVTIEWYELTIAVINGLEKNMGCKVTVQDLISGAEMLKGIENDWQSKTIQRIQNKQKRKR